jgi:hypothetical protein|tara:strand:- start:33 stop:302 length:270 start_codon:yes stop_codon:yes gene_type:complete
MTTVNVTTTENTVSVTENGTSTVVKTPVTTVVTATTTGPQGPEGPAGSNFSLNQTAKVDKSVVYYDSASGEYRADDTWTINTIVLGGNF